MIDNFSKIFDSSIFISLKVLVSQIEEDELFLFFNWCRVIDCECLLKMFHFK